MRINRYIPLIMLTGLCLAKAVADGADTASSVLWYNQPARSWMTEALPLGNGSLGGMFFGLTQTERVQFNQDTLWTGNENDTGDYQAFGDIFIQLGHGNPQDYRRELNIDTASLKVSYTSGGIHYKRLAFVSHPAHVLVYHFTADKPGAYTGRIWLTDMHGAKIQGKGDRLMAIGQLAKGGLHYESQLRVLHTGGSVRVETSDVSGNPLKGVPDVGGRKLPRVSLVFEKCDSITLVLAAGTDYLADYTKHWRGDNPHAAVTRHVDAVTAGSVMDLYKAHVADYQSFYHRFRIDLGTTSQSIADQPTDKRLLAYTKNKTHDPDLEELFVNYGRYLLISCSRPGSMPANLQGLWNDKNNPPWRCDYHSNINVEMNYWPSESTHLGDCQVPFLHYVLSQIPIYREHTRKQYPKTNCGWTVHTENGIFGGGTWKWNSPGSAWYAQHFWEHYAYGMDKDYLRKEAYPLLKELCKFWQERLIKRPDGTLVTPKGWSPEHGPVEEGITYDLEIVYNLFSNYIDAADALGIDKDYRNQVADMRARLLKPKIGRWGQLQEWEEDRDDPNDHHRHVSHLFGLYPGRQITATGTPKLFKAARVSLEARGDEGTGWSIAWKENLWARLRDGDHAYRLLSDQLHYTEQTRIIMSDAGGTYPNLFDAHPPFQIDGNFGAVSAVTEMLLQSDDHYTDPKTGERGYIIDLLPALPKAWPTGSVSGICARGGYVLSIEWANGELKKARIVSKCGTVPVIRYKGKLLDPAGDARIILIKETGHGMAESK